MKESVAKKVWNRLSDKKIYELIDSLKLKLRIVENINGKEWKRELLCSVKIISMYYIKINSNYK